MSERLRGKVAVVTGATRGGGRGIAVELGAAGATVYVTGRTTRASHPRGYEGLLAEAALERMPGTIEDTADEVTRVGGRGIAVRCDHTREQDVRALFERVGQEHGGLDLLVNNAWGGHEAFSMKNFDRPFWEQPLDQWRANVDHGAFQHLLASICAAPLFVRQQRGLIVATTFWDEGGYLKGNLLYDVAKAAINRVAFATAQELRPHGVASVAVAPGWMRTELVLASTRATEDSWHEHPHLARTESPRYLGRAVAALAEDLDVMAKSGEVLYVAELARQYGFTDVDGRQPERFRVT